jgi:ATP-dependent DNA helicase RecG
VGTSAFSDLERTKAGLIERLHLRIEVDEIFHPDGRVLVFHVPSRPLGVAIQFKGAYWMRGGEDLVPMTPDLLKRIFAETGPDFSAEICPKATMA